MLKTFRPLAYLAALAIVGTAHACAVQSDMEDAAGTPPATVARQA
ncbi:hypothetical protein [Cupriavidus basilensis]